MSGLEIDVAHMGSECVIRVSGEIDVENAEDLASVGVLTASSTEAGYLVIDLDGVPFMDSAGLGALVRVRNAARAESRGVVLRGPRPRVLKVIKITGVDRLFTIEPAEQQDGAIDGAVDDAVDPDVSSVSHTA
ncbi:MAG: STAS domain-containing protein [Actinomycetota bacterium]|nr:STAS domain-containing protein [Actinomycetota bacterium]